MKNTFTLILTILFSYSASGQTKTDAQKNKLLGKVKTTFSYKVNYEKKGDTIFFSKNFYNENGMKTKYIPYENDYGYKPIRGLDSISYFHDKQNRLIRSSEYEWFRDNYDEAKEYRETRTETYSYDQNCNDISSNVTTILKIAENETDTTTWKVMYRYDKECRATFMEEIGRGRTNTTVNDYDQKGRVIKRTFTYTGDKPDKLETYLYDDQNNTLTYVEYSPRYDVYREKTVTQFNKNNKATQKTFFNAPIAGGSITFTTGSKSEPDQIHLIRKYQYDNDDKLITETHLDGKNNELLKVEVFYDENGALKEQKFHKAGKLEYREEYKYENGKRVEEKQFLPNKKTPEYIKTRKYNAKNQLTEYVLLEDNNKYSNEYIYDKFDNEIEKKELKNGKLINTEFTQIAYYP